MQLMYICMYINAHALIGCGLRVIWPEYIKSSFKYLFRIYIIRNENFMLSSTLNIIYLFAIRVYLHASLHKFARKYFGQLIKETYIYFQVSDSNRLKPGQWTQSFIN